LIKHESAPAPPSSCLNSFLFFLHLLLYFCPQLTPEEEEKRRVRRERNKLAAAKCRNRRRELTEMLQGVSGKPANRIGARCRVPLQSHRESVLSCRKALWLVDNHATLLWRRRGEYARLIS